MRAPGCRVYWGSHGCSYERGHPADQPCRCDCADQPLTAEDIADGVRNVGAAPYYGEETRFYGEDVAVRGLPPL